MNSADLFPRNPAEYLGSTSTAVQAAEIPLDSGDVVLKRLDLAWGKLAVKDADLQLGRRPSLMVLDLPRSFARGGGIHPPAMEAGVAFLR